LTTQVQLQITSLTTLKAKIDTDTDLTTLKADIKSIVDSYRIHLLFVPKTHVLVVADTILQATDKFTNISTRLQTLITQAQSAGKDVTSLNTALADMNSKVTDATTQSNNAVSSVVNLQPAADTSPYKPAFETAKTDLLSGRTDLQK